MRFISKTIRAISSVVIISLFFLSCQSEQKRLNNTFGAKLISFGNDRIINQSELKQLDSLIALSNSGFKIGKLFLRDSESLRQYINQRNWDISISDESLNLNSFVIYLENSASMKGYVGPKGNGDFASPIIALSHCGNQSTKYIARYVGADAKDNVIFNQKPVNDFFSDLSRGSFAVAPSSPIHSILSTAVDSLLASNNGKVEDVFCLITDGLMSGSNAEIRNNPLFNIQNLPYLEDCIRNAVNKAKTNNLDCLVYRLETPFNGTYYDHKNGRHQLNGIRPFFMFMIGDKQNLILIESNLAKEQSFANRPSRRFATYDVSSATTVTKGLLKPVANGNVVVKPAGSRFKVEYDPRNVNDLTPISFIIQMNLNTLPSYYVSQSYLEKGLQLSYKDMTSGVEVVIPVGEWLMNVQIDETTKVTILNVSLDLSSLRRIGTNLLTITLAGSLDDWYNTLSSADDSHIQPEDNDTFALSYLMGGIMKGFDYQSAGAIPKAIDFSFELGRK